MNPETEYKFLNCIGLQAGARQEIRKKMFADVMLHYEINIIFE